MDDLHLIKLVSCLIYPSLKQELPRVNVLWAFGNCYELGHIHLIALHSNGDPINTGPTTLDNVYVSRRRWAVCESTDGLEE